MLAPRQSMEIASANLPGINPTKGGLVSIRDSLNGGGGYHHFPVGKNYSFHVVARMDYLSVLYPILLGGILVIPGYSHSLRQN